MSVKFLGTERNLTWKTGHKKVVELCTFCMSVKDLTITFS